MIDPETIIDGRYRVISRLGSGGMADVTSPRTSCSAGRSRSSSCTITSPKTRSSSSASAARPRAPRRLSHPNIVAIFDRGEWNGTYYIAMEYVAGARSRRSSASRARSTRRSAIDIVVQILRAARFAHKRGVIHRDLKPHNVILDEEGRARVTDFGIARAGASDMTLTGSIMGTAQYLSPEQAQGLAVSSASDLYSVGVILYELLTGVVPFEGETAVAIAFKQVSAEPQPPSALKPGIPASLDAVVLRALAKDPAQRYADADELIAALEHERQALPALSATAAPDGHAHHAAPPAALRRRRLAARGAGDRRVRARGRPRRRSSNGAGADAAACCGRWRRARAGPRRGRARADPVQPDRHGAEGDRAVRTGRGHHAARTRASTRCRR